MKIKGQKIEGPNVEYIVIPRGDREDIVFVVEAVLDSQPFDDMCPVPEPPTRINAGSKVPTPNLKDKNFLKAVQLRSEKRFAWMILESLKATPELEWETVDMGDQSTWLNFQKELTDSGFSDVEIQRILAGVVSVNALNEAKIEAALQSFLLTKQELSELSDSLADGQVDTQSGEPASV